jgi:hypothetical protein
MAAAAAAKTSGYSTATMFGLILMMAWSSSCWASSWQENVRPIMFVPYGKICQKNIFFYFSFMVMLFLSDSKSPPLKQEMVNSIGVEK